MGFEGHPFSDVIVVRQQWNDKGFQPLHKGKQRARTTESGVWKCSHNFFTGTVTAKICRDKEVGKVGRSFDVSFDIGEVAVLATEMSKEEETWRRGTMGMTPHPTATNNVVERFVDEVMRTSRKISSLRIFYEIENLEVKSSEVQKMDHAEKDTSENKPEVQNKSCRKMREDR